MLGKPHQNLVLIPVGQVPGRQELATLVVQVCRGAQRAQRARQAQRRARERRANRGRVRAGQFGEPRAGGVLPQVGILAAQSVPPAARFTVPHTTHAPTFQAASGTGTVPNRVVQRNRLLRPPQPSQHRSTGAHDSTNLPASHPSTRPSDHSTSSCTAWPPLAPPILTLDPLHPRTRPPNPTLSPTSPAAQRHLGRQVWLVVGKGKLKVVVGGL